MPHQKPEAVESKGWSGIRVAGFFWNPDVSIAPTKPWRHDTDQRACRAVQDIGLVQNGWVRVEVVDPRLIPQDKDRSSPRLIVRWLHDPPQQRRHAQKFEGPRRNHTSFKPLRTLPVGIQHVRLIIRND